MTATLLAVGEQAILVDLTTLDAVHAINRLARRCWTDGTGPWAGVVDVIPAAATVLVTTGSPGEARALWPELQSLVTAAVFHGHLLHERPDEASAPTVEIPVHYDGPDLADIAGLTGLSVPDVIRAHTSRPWRMAFGGFAPGFPYLVDGDPRLVVPRRQSPRTLVPTGAVGLAGQFSGVYPRESPGGWQLLGHTELKMWDVDREPPALVQPGWLVRFVDAGEG